VGAIVTEDGVAEELRRSRRQPVDIVGRRGVVDEAEVVGLVTVAQDGFDRVGGIDYRFEPGRRAQPLR
jgi:hypothetical protein